MSGIIGLINCGNNNLFDSVAQKFNYNSSGVFIENKCSVNIDTLVIDEYTSINPVFDERNDVICAFEGQIFNRQYLMNELNISDDTVTNQQLFLDLYLRFGDNCFVLLDGMFVAALYFLKDDTVKLVRDKAGVKPLYYSYTYNTFSFSSNPKDILLNGLCSKKLNNTAVSQYFIMGFIPSPITAYDDVLSVDAGEVVTFRNGNISRNYYWDIECDEKYMIADYDECKKQLRETFIKSVDSQMAFGGRTGVFLSGGIDSTIVTGVASCILGKKIDSFTMGFKVEAYNESERADIVAREHNTNHHVFMLDFDEALDKMDAVINGFTQPFADASAIPTYIINEYASKTLNTVLTGDASDQMYAGSNKYQINYYIDKYEKIPAFLRKSIVDKMIYALPVENTLAKKMRKVIACAGMDEYNRRERILALCMGKDEVAKLIGKNYVVDCMSELKKIYDKYDGRADELTRTLYMDLKTVVEGGMIAKMGMMSRAAGVETRMPFTSTDMMELAYKIPSKFKLSGTVGKKIIKETFADIIPEDLQKASKKGFGVPLDVWFRGPLKDDLKKSLNRDAIESRGIFNYDYVNKLMEEHFSRRSDNANKLWALYVFEKWADSLRL